MSIVELLELDVLSTLSVAVWLLSALAGAGVIIYLSLKQVFLPFFVLLMMSFSQWYIFLAVLLHKGYEHGWAIHFVSEFTAYGYAIAAIANFSLFMWFINKK